MVWGRGVGVVRRSLGFWRDMTYRRVCSNGHAGSSAILDDADLGRSQLSR